MSEVDLPPYVPLSDEPPLADTPLWLSHHHPEAYDRCAVVAGRHVVDEALDPSDRYGVGLLVRMVASLVSLYATLVTMQAIGLYYRHFSDRFPWSAG